MINRQKIKLGELVANSSVLDGGSGFVMRMTPKDNPYIYLPYAGTLEEVTFIEGSNDTTNLFGKAHAISLRFTNDFFIPPTVHERMYLPALYGNHMYGGMGVGAGSRDSRERIAPQPDTKLEFYVVIIGSVTNDSIKLTHKLLKNLHKEGYNKRIKLNPTWMDAGTEIGHITCGVGTVIYTVNRPMSFASDIRYYSKIDDDTPLHKPIDCLMQQKDVVGGIL